MLRIALCHWAAPQKEYGGTSRRLVTALIANIDILKSI